MSTGISANKTRLMCSEPLLDLSRFGIKGGYQPSRYCGLDSLDNGTTCCFPCPIQDWVYSPDWKNQLRVPNYLSIFSVILCFFLLLSFAVLPASATHRHYLSVGLLLSVLFISLSFVLPVGINPEMCYDDITPNNMGSSILCAWTGSLITLGGLGCAIWVFLRSLWLHIRIFWDRDPGRKFKWGSIIAGTVFPIIFLVAVLTVTGFSYRMGQTCFPNHENAIVTFWIWLVAFSVAGFILQVVTTGYCVWVYVRTIRKANRGHQNTVEDRRVNQKAETWANVKHIFLLQWRNILVSIFTIVGSIAFFIVFWIEDDKLRRIHDPGNTQLVQRWINCQTLSIGDKEECKNLVKDFTVPQASVLTSLILASLVGIEIFVLLFRLSMLTAWRDLVRSQYLRVSPIHRPPSPELTSLENPDRFTPLIPKNSPYISEHSPDTRSIATSDYSSNVELGGMPPTQGAQQRPSYERTTSDQFLLPAASLSAVIDRQSESATTLGANTATMPHRMNSTGSRFSKMVPSRASSIQRTKSSKARGRISMPVPGSFVHVDGVDVRRVPNEETGYNHI